MNERPPRIDETVVELVCWRGWCNGPTDGLALWRGRVYWFDYLDIWDDGEAEWGYDYALYEIDDRLLNEAVEWFREKERWFFDSELTDLRPEEYDARLRERFTVERGLSLRDWGGPVLTTKPVGWFRHRDNRDWFAVNTQERWRLPGDWPAGTA
jgi:hypothetical protein